MMLLQIYFDIAPERAQAFERLYAASYVPALQKQQGYLESKLLRLFPPEMAHEIQAAPCEYNYQIDLVFDNEANRRLWVASEEHRAVWPMASAMATRVAWRGHDVVGSDERGA